MYAMVDGVGVCVLGSVIFFVDVLVAVVVRIGLVGAVVVGAEVVGAGVVGAGVVGAGAVVHADLCVGVIREVVVSVSAVCYRLCSPRYVCDVSGALVALGRGRVLVVVISGLVHLVSL